MFDMGLKENASSLLYVEHNNTIESCLWDVEGSCRDVTSYLWLKLSTNFPSEKAPEKIDSVKCKNPEQTVCADFFPSWLPGSLMMWFWESRLSFNFLPVALETLPVQVESNKQSGIHPAVRKPQQKQAVLEIKSWYLHGLRKRWTRRWTRLCSFRSAVHKIPRFASVMMIFEASGYKRTFSNLRNLNLCTSHILLFGCLRGHDVVGSGETGLSQSRTGQQQSRLNPDFWEQKPEGFWRKSVWTLADCEWKGGLRKTQKSSRKD